MHFNCVWFLPLAPWIAHIYALDASRFLHYDAPADEFEASLPVGNGRIGGLVYGRATELIQLNENSFWSGLFLDRVNPDGIDHWEDVREKLTNGSLSEANDEVLQYMVSIPDNPRSYQPLVDLHVDADHANASVSGFERWLDTTTGVAGVKYDVSNATFTREVFASHPAGILIARFNTTAVNGMDATISLSREQNVYTQTADASDTNSLILNAGTEENQDDGMYFASEARVLTDGGSVAAGETSLSVTGANTISIYFDAETSYRFQSMDAAQAEASRKLDNAASSAYDDLYANGIEDHASLMDRVSLDLGSSDEDAASLSTDARVTAFADDADSDVELMTLMFNYGRHLLIASSRDTGASPLPPNLQGIWNEDYDPAWGSKYTININIEMNYWPAEITNLADTHEALFSFLESAQERGQQVAQELYGVDGFVFHHNLDVWGDAAPTDNGTSWTMWPMGGVWMATHFMEHYRFTGDEAFLQERALPFMLDTAEFFYGYHFEFDGYYATGPSISPENSYIVPENMTNAGDEEGIDLSPAMDNELLWQLFTDIVEASEVLGLNGTDLTRAQDYLDNLQRPQIGSNGQILEWRIEYEEASLGHRHLSPLWGLHPGRQMTPLVNSTLADASKVLLDRRVEHGGGSTGWSCSWVSNCYARLFDGENAWTFAQRMLSQYALPNLWNSNDGPPFQIDGNFGYVSAIAEMLLQSQSGAVHLLPALPSQVPKGSVTGLVARGGFVVDIAWSDGALTEATVTSKLGNDLTIRVADGADFDVDGSAQSGSFATQAGHSYTITLS